MKARGVAQVIAVLAAPAAAAGAGAFGVGVTGREDGVRRVESCFRSSEKSQASALRQALVMSGGAAAAAAALPPAPASVTFPNLGVVLGTRLDWAIGNGVKIISMSLGFRGWWEDFIPILQIIRSRGILPVIAVGNEGAGTSRSPGNYPTVLSVGAEDETPAVAWFSSSQTFARTDDALVPDMVAPGVNVISAAPGKKYQSMSGSSMATPHVAGLAALLWEAKLGATATEIETALCDSCRLTGALTSDRANRGEPDAVNAFTRLTGIGLPTVGTSVAVGADAAEAKIEGKTQDACTENGAERECVTETADASRRPFETREKNGRVNDADVISASLGVSWRWAPSVRSASQASRASPYRGRLLECGRDASRPAESCPRLAVC